VSFYSTVRLAIAQATQTVSGTSDAFNIGEFIEGTLHVRVVAMTGTNPRVTPRFQVSPNAQQWATLRSYATSIRATGLSIMTLPRLADQWGRISYTIAGTAANINLIAYWVGKGMY
jgi:hypothetical protein